MRRRRRWWCGSVVQLEVETRFIACVYDIYGLGGVSAAGVDAIVEVFCCICFYCSSVSDLLSDCIQFKELMIRL